MNLDTPVLKVRDKWRSLSCYQQSLTILAQIHLCLPTVKKNCAELYKSGKTTSGVYTIDPDGLGAFKSSVTKRQAVGGWTVLPVWLGFKTFQMDEKPHRAAGSPNPSIFLSEPLQSRDVLN